MRLRPMFALARQLPAANASTHAGKWEKSKFMGVEVTGKTLGVIGCGNIGSIVADRALGLKMKVVAYDPFASRRSGRWRSGSRKWSWMRFSRRADFITLHTPSTDQTRGIIDAKSLAKCRKGVRIINCARGGLVVEAILKAALDSGQVAGTAIGACSPKNRPSRIFCSAWRMWYARRIWVHPRPRRRRTWRLQILEQMSDFLLTGAIVNALNMPSVSAEDAPKLKPYMKLAEQLGALAGQVTQSGIKSVGIEYEGHAATLNTRPLRNVLLMGLLASRSLDLRKYGQCAGSGQGTRH